MCTPNSFNISTSNYSSLCDFILKSGNCVLESGFINYYQWQYCAFGSHVAPTILMLLWLIVLLLTIGITADSFFAPCLVVVTRILRMSQNLAGVTLLALGNGAADVFSSLSAVISGEKPNVGLSFGSLIGAGILVNTLTAGVIMIIHPFTANRRPIMKDLVFYLIGQILCMVVLITKKVTLGLALSFLVVYIIYVFVTGLGRVVYIKYCEKPPSEDDDNKGEDNEEFEKDNPETTMKYSNNSIKFGSKTSSTNDGRSIELVNVTSSKFESDNPAFAKVEDKTKTPKYSKNVSSAPISTRWDQLRSMPWLNMSQKGHSVTTKAPATSHRKPGFLAQIIMANEVQKDWLKTHNEIEVERIDRNRTKSVTPGLIPEREHRIRFMSVCSPRPSSFDVSSRNSPAVSRVQSIMKKPNHIEEDSSIQGPLDNVSLSSDNRAVRVSTDSVLNDPEQNTLIANYYVDFPGLWMHFLYTIIPCDLDSWSEQSILEKIMIIVQAPMTFLLTLTVPVVDESSCLQGWCKLLNAFHCLISPIVWFIMLKLYNVHILSTDFVLIYLPLIIGVFLVITVLLTSQADAPPVYHPLYSFVGFITAIIWIYAVANEIVNILTVFGIVFNIADTVLGLSVLAFANSIGDLVSNIMLARRNFPRIAYAACVGGPLFNLLIGFGLPFSIKAAKATIEVEIKSETLVLLSTIMLITIMNIIVLPLMKFRLRPAYGVVLLVIYVAFFIIVMLFATETIKVAVP